MTYIKPHETPLFLHLLVLISWRLTDLAKKSMDPLIALLRECSKGRTAESHGHVATKLAGGPSFTVKVARGKKHVFQEGSVGTGMSGAEPILDR